MKAIALALLLLLPVLPAPAQNEKLNDAFLLRQMKRFPAADLNRDGRLTAEEWREFQAGARLRKEMSDEEAAVLRTTGDSGARVPPTHAEVAYGPLPEQRLNLWLVPAAKPTPVIVHIHGGGFIQGNKQAAIDAAIHGKLAAAGVSYASIQYKFQSKDHPLPEVLRGIARAVQFLRHGADEWNLDKTRFAGFGGSAGAAASAWLGMRDDLADPDNADPVLRESSRLQAVWAISVAATMDVWEWPKYNPLFTEKMIPSWIERWGYDRNTGPDDPLLVASRPDLRFSLLASADDAPMVIYNEHFADNVAHNPAASKALYDICRAAGMDVQIYLREELNNLDDAPGLFDWLIGQLAKPAASSAEPESPVALLIHGGAGVRRSDLSEGREQAARGLLEQALLAGHAALKKGGSGLDAVETAIVLLEDAPEFNAGRGSALNADGVVEMDASIMDGGAFRAGAVAGVTEVRNPIQLARKVMSATPHVLLIGEGAKSLAREQGLPFESPEWFVTPRQGEMLEREKKKARESGALREGTMDSSARMGTVGAVALDASGNLAAGTSTGGLSNKRAGRVGDSPIIGAGTYAENGVCAVSCTGQGEYFIRGVLAYQVAARIQYANATVAEAAREVIHRQLQEQGGTGGMIALDSRGRPAVSFNTEGMFHGWIAADGEMRISIFEQ